MISVLKNTLYYYVGTKVPIQNTYSYKWVKRTCLKVNYNIYIIYIEFSVTKRLNKTHNLSKK